MNYMTEELAIAINIVVSYLKQQLTTLTPQLFIALGTIFGRFVEQNNSFSHAANASYIAWTDKSETSPLFVETQIALACGGWVG